MTGLERVREYLKWSGASELLVLVDAHLKEDAERDKALDEWRAGAMKWKPRADKAEAENARLREDPVGYANDAYEREIGRLREELDLKDGLLNQAKGELDRLRPMEHKYAEALNREAEADIRYEAELARANDHFNEAVRERDGELARLRERLDQCKARWEGAADELAKLSEEMKRRVAASAERTQMDGAEIAGLRERADLWETRARFAQAEVSRLWKKLEVAESYLTGDDRDAYFAGRDHD